MGSKCKCSHNAGLQVAIGTVKDTGKQPGLQFDFNILLSAHFWCSAGYVCYHRNNSCFHSAKFSVITGYLLCSVLAITISKMLVQFLKTNWQETTKYWSANCMYCLKCPGLKTSIIKQCLVLSLPVSTNYWLAHGKAHQTKELFHWNQWECSWELQRVEKDVPSKHIHFTASSTPIFWPESGICE